MRRCSLAHYRAASLPWIDGIIDVVAVTLALFENDSFDGLISLYEPCPLVQGLNATVMLIVESRADEMKEGQKWRDVRPGVVVYRTRYKASHCIPLISILCGSLPLARA